MDKAALYKIVEEIADEWQMGGLSGEDNLYAELAVLTAQRAIAAEREACAKVAMEHARGISKGTLPRLEALRK